MKKSIVIAALTVTILSLFLTACGTSGAAPAASAATSTAPKASASTPAAPSPSAAVSSPSAANPSGSAAATASGQLQLTLTELAKYDGKNGNPAYVAINGVIYDVSNVPQWKGGTHQGNTAGKDLTSVIKNAPHGTSVLKTLPVVGKLVG